MNWEAISGIAEITGAFVVVISLIYVAIQIQQNTKAIRHQTTQDLIKTNSESAYILATDEGLADIFQRGCFDRASLTESEQLRFNTYVYGYYNQIDYLYDQYVAGWVAEKTWQKIERELPIWLSLPGVREWWDQDKTRFSDEFVRFLDEKLVNFDNPKYVPTIGKPSDEHAT